MRQTLRITLHGESILLHPAKAIYWMRQGMLILADLHLGKANHFRKAGVPVPQEVNQGNLQRLWELLQIFQPSRVLFLGDLFHSHWNRNWQDFTSLIAHFNSISFELAVGNHDILHQELYWQANITLHPNGLVLNPFYFTHDTTDQVPAFQYPVCGHRHPGLRMKGQGRQQLQLPCFYFGSENAILPAFGSFTGLSIIKPSPDDVIFPVAGDQVIRVSESMRSY